LKGGKDAITSFLILFVPPEVRHTCPGTIKTTNRVDFFAVCAKIKQN
jgi:hypothetical protein